MNTHVDFKYNPGFKSDDELRKQFVVRKRELKILLDIIKDNTGSASNRHVLLIGPRGVGKTTLARRISAELRLNSDFSRYWFPITLGEESYSVTSTGEFWLECVYHLQESTGQERLKKRYRDLRQIEDDGALLEGCVTTLIEESHAIGRRFIVIVENLNSLLETQMSLDDAWSFRHALQNHPEIMLLATATSTFDQIDNDELALFEQFKVHHVQPLSTRECRILWSSISNENLSENQIRPIQILTGGNPRLIRILAEFTRDSVFLDLVNKLAFLIDQYTDYFRSQLEILPATERKVFVALLELWDPAPTRQVAAAARLAPNLVSANLKRLQSRGAVVKEGANWQASERLFNIYYLMRRRGTPSSRVQALVRFMTVYYGKEELPNRACALAKEACELTPPQREAHFYVVSEIFGHLDPHARRNLASNLPTEFLNAPDAPAALQEVLKALKAQSGPDIARSEKEVDLISEILDAILDDKDLDRAEALLSTLGSNESDDAIRRVAMGYIAMAKGDMAESERYSREIVNAKEHSAPGLFLLVWTLIGQQKADEAINWAHKLVDQIPDYSHSWNLLGKSYLGLEEPDLLQARKAFERALELDPKAADTLVELAEIDELEDNLEGAERYFKAAIKLKDSPAFVWGGYGNFLLYRRKRYRDAERLFERFVKKWPHLASGWARLAIATNRVRGPLEARGRFAEAFERNGQLLPLWVSYAKFLDDLREYDEAKDAWHRAVNCDDADGETWFEFGRFLRRHGDWEAAEAAFRRATEFDPSNASIWEGLGAVLAAQEGRFDEAEAALLEALKRAPDACWSWHALGKLYEQEGRHADADAQYLRAVELSGGCGCAVAALLSERTGYGRDLVNGRAIVDELVKAEPHSARAHMLRARFLRCSDLDLKGAEREIALAMEIEPGHPEVFLEAVRLSIAQASSEEEAVNAFENLVDEMKPCEHILNSTAWQLAADPGRTCKVVAAHAANIALEKDPSSVDIKHTLATSFLRMGEFEKSFDFADEIVNSAEEIELVSVVEFLIEFSQRAHDFIPRLINILNGSHLKDDLEPLYIAFRMMQGESVSVAKEVYEVALDILSRIREGAGE